jgi:hypothetical protein
MEYAYLVWIALLVTIAVAVAVFANFWAVIRAENLRATRRQDYLVSLRHYGTYLATDDQRKSIAELAHYLLTNAPEAATNNPAVLQAIDTLMVDQHAVGDVHGQGVALRAFLGDLARQLYTGPMPPVPTKMSVDMAVPENVTMVTVNQLVISLPDSE